MKFLEFLKPCDFSHGRFSQEVQDYCNLLLEEYAKKYREDYANISIDRSNAGEINSGFFDSINQRFKEII